MLPVPHPQPLRPSAPETRDGGSAPAPLFVERRATRRATAPGGAEGARSRHVRALAVVAPFAIVATYLLAGLVAATAVSFAFLLAAQGFAIAALRVRAVRLDHLSKTDELTGLGNSRALWEELRELTSTVPVALIMLDLDHFKRVNDEFGHTVGDALLRHAGRAIRVAVGDAGHCYRYGGEELVAVLPSIDEQAGCVVADRLRAIIVRPPRDLPPVTASAGVAVGTPGDVAHHLVDRADRALRLAKANGRDRTVPATQAEDWAADQEDSVVAARRAALAMATAALDARDPDTAEHSDEVVMLCEALAERLGISGREREQLITAARLHDVGKVAVPHQILGKPGELDDDEWAVMREHTITGERILCSVPELAPVAPIVRHAHERYDGGGYPDGLVGEEIPLASRIILCADAFHAIRSDRPYRAARSVDEALHELIENAGGQFDPSVAASLVDFVREVRTRESAVASLGTAMRRSPRLLALLLTLVVSGTAFAADRPLRKVFTDVLPGRARKAHALPRPAAAPATCATVNLEGTSCSPKIAAFGALTAPAPASPDAPAFVPAKLTTVPDLGLARRGSPDGAIGTGGLLADAVPDVILPTASAPATSDLPPAPAAVEAPAPLSPAVQPFVPVPDTAPTAVGPTGGTGDPTVVPGDVFGDGDGETVVGDDEPTGDITPPPADDQTGADAPVDVVPDPTPADPGVPADPSPPVDGDQPPVDPGQPPVDPGAGDTPPQADAGGQGSPPDDVPADPGLPVDTPAVDPGSVGGVLAPDEPAPDQPAPTPVGEAPVAPAAEPDLTPVAAGPPADSPLA